MAHMSCNRSNTCRTFQIRSGEDKEGCNNTALSKCFLSIKKMQVFCLMAHLYEISQICKCKRTPRQNRQHTCTWFHLLHCYALGHENGLLVHDYKHKDRRKGPIVLHRQNHNNLGQIGESGWQKSRGMFQKLIPKGRNNSSNANFDQFCCTQDSHHSNHHGKAPSKRGIFNIVSNKAETLLILFRSMTVL